MERQAAVRAVAVTEAAARVVGAKAAVRVWAVVMVAVEMAAAEMAAVMEAAVMEVGVRAVAATEVGVGVTGAGQTLHPCRVWCAAPLFPPSSTWARRWGKKTTHTDAHIRARKKNSRRTLTTHGNAALDEWSLKPRVARAALTIFESGSAWGSVASKIHSPTMVTAWPTPPSSPSSCTVVG